MKIKKLVINDFRKFKNTEFRLGKHITVISGTNAVGKSTILGILGNSSEIKVKEGKPLIHKQFRTEFSEIFRMSQENDPSGSNKLTVTFDNNEYRTMRTTWQFDKKSKTYRPRLIPEYKDSANKKHSTKQHWPTLFLGLSRLFPLGESEEINLKETPYLLDSAIEDSFKQTYKHILSLPDEITKTATIKIPETKRKTVVGISTEDYDTFANSSGQDNLGQILLAVESFRLLRESNQSKYEGGLLLIDEIDATLHPSAQNRLFDYLFKKSKELELQIVCTTHSLSLLKHISSKIEHNGEGQNDIELYYLTIANINLQNYRNPPYSTIKSNLIEIPIFTQSKKLNIITEDEEARWTIQNIIEGTPLQNKINLMPIKLSCTAIISFMKGDPLYFADKIVILDGDVLSSSDKSLTTDFTKFSSNPAYTLITLPSNTSPEKEIYNFLTSRSDSSQSYLNQDACFNHGLSLQQLENISFDKNNREEWKAWFNDNKVFFDSTNLFYYYKENNKEKLEAFIEQLTECYKKLAAKGHAPDLSN